MASPASVHLPVMARESPRPKAAFEQELGQHGMASLSRSALTTVQINVGKRCNQACHHCHVDAGPARVESMGRDVAERVVRLVARAPSVDLVDITGGAPELNPHFRWLVRTLRGHGVQVMDRCNLTILFEPGMQDLPAFLADHQVAVTASLPCYGPGNVDKQRGKGVFDRSIRALRILNQHGYGLAGTSLPLDLVYNPLGASLPPPQVALESRYREVLRAEHGIEFNRLLTLTNMPIQRFARSLERQGQYDAYMSLLVNHFNPATIEHLMCRTLLSVGYNGRLYDCDFNQMLEIALGAPRRDRATPTTVWELDSLQDLAGQRVATAEHCFGCTAGAGSSCGGALQ
ncbi:MAG: arsenosugar biosynthesis radical SAM protein ArsS [Proteobacteria bacterium]|nr:arsenosugar biosynthesis radical SAM protein ArsS [Pseudomonadota bacterium]